MDIKCFVYSVKMGELKEFPNRELAEQHVDKHKLKRGEYLLMTFAELPIVRDDFQSIERSI